MRNPPIHLRVCDIKEWYVKYLVNLIEKEDHEELTAPLLVIASVGPAEFRPSLVSTYTYEVKLLINNYIALRLGLYYKMELYSVSPTIINCVSPIYML